MAVNAEGVRRGKLVLGSSRRRRTRRRDIVVVDVRLSFQGSALDPRP